MIILKNIMVWFLLFLSLYVQSFLSLHLKFICPDFFLVFFVLVLFFLNKYESLLFMIVSIVLWKMFVWSERDAFLFIFPLCMVIRMLFGFIIEERNRIFLFMESSLLFSMVLFFKLAARFFGDALLEKNIGFLTFFSYYYGHIISSFVFFLLMFFVFLILNKLLEKYREVKNAPY